MLNNRIFLKKRAKQQERSLLGACLAHILHDGYTDQLYALLPVWQAQFGLSYMGLAIVRALYSATMGGLQVPARSLHQPVEATIRPRTFDFSCRSRGFSSWRYPLASRACAQGSLLAGVGSSVQHPRASHLVDPELWL